MTGLTLVLTGVWSGDLSGAAMTNTAFSMDYGFMGGIFLTVSLALFAFTTILGWNYYGETCLPIFIVFKGSSNLIPYYSSSA